MYCPHNAAVSKASLLPLTVIEAEKCLFECNIQVIQRELHVVILVSASDSSVTQYMFGYSIRKSMTGTITLKWPKWTLTLWSGFPHHGNQTWVVWLEINSSLNLMIQGRVSCRSVIKELFSQSSALDDPKSHCSHDTGDFLKKEMGTWYLADWCGCVESYVFPVNIIKY